MTPTQREKWVGYGLVVFTLSPLTDGAVCPVDDLADSGRTAETGDD